MPDLLKKFLKNHLSNNVYNNILVNWSEIAGKKNKELLFPVSVKNGALFVATPNPMVKSYVVNLAHIIVAKVNRIVPGSNITFVKFSVRPEFFENKSVGLKSEGEQPVKQLIEINADDLEKLKTKLINDGISEAFAEKMAIIELTILQKS